MTEGEEVCLLNKGARVGRRRNRRWRRRWDHRGRVQVTHSEMKKADKGTEKEIRREWIGQRRKRKGIIRTGILSSL